jgi:hypothetical protein
MLMKIRRPYHSGRWYSSIQKQAYPRMRRASDVMFKETRELKQLPEILIAMGEVNENAFWKVRPPPKRKKEVRTA